jgi:hypothetical protein
MKAATSLPPQRAPSLSVRHSGEDAVMHESPEVRELALRLFQAAAAGDNAALLAAVSREADVLFIGTDPGEWWRGYESVAHALTTPPDTEPSGGSIVAPEGLAYEAGEVGWAAVHGKVSFPGEAPIPLRLTLVCQREQAGWRVVQWHVSIGVPNEDAFQKTVIFQTG